MSENMTSIDEQRTWETTPLQRGLVDSCFEEGQYEMAILTLDQLRSPQVNPWPPHLRQVIYISLQSTQETVTKDEIDTLQLSPSKLVKQHQYRLSLSLIPAIAVINARRLLMSYLHTNSPTALSRSLPRRRSMSGTLPMPGEGDSMVAKRSMSVTQCKDCWELLGSEFLSHQTAVAFTPKPKPRPQRSSQIGPHFTGSTETGPSLVVTEEAWSLLEWLVSLFELDEELNEKKANNRYSPLLVEQILDDNGKAYLDVPASIISSCLTQVQIHRQNLAGRLLLLLINMTSITELDMQPLVVAIYTRTSSSLSPSQVSLLMAQLNRSIMIPVLQFKIGLCQTLIGGLGSKSATANAPRPQPRMRARGHKTVDVAEPPKASAPSKVSVPTATEILQLFGTPFSEQDEPDTPPLASLEYKYQLLSTYGTLQTKLPSAEQDSDWVKLLNESLSERVHDILQQKGQEADLYGNLLKSQIVHWQQLTGVQ